MEEEKNLKCEKCEVRLRCDDKQLQACKMQYQKGFNDGCEVSGNRWQKGRIPEYANVIAAYKQGDSIYYCEVAILQGVFTCYDVDGLKESDVIAWMRIPKLPK